ncbi:hypothetical protein Fmac_016861 [Flemingia macrophylla]|uniref:CASP-like protein n=1 Tax=Flemingia macrophylla TaxID=520843 RepID=A0ABD1MIN4_9FABA
MTTTKSETLAQENKGHKTKGYSDNSKEEEAKPSKKNEQHHHNHTVSESPRSISFNASKPTSVVPTLQDSLNLSISDGELQMVVASLSHSSVSDGAIKVVNSKEEPMKTMVEVMDVEEVEEGTYDNDDDDDDDDVVHSKLEGKWYIVLLGLRIAAFVLCKVAFFVLASDQRKKVRITSTTWSSYYAESSSQIRWYDFPEFKYCLSVNVIGFVYSAMQICDLLKYLYTKRHTVDPRLRASSSAATVAYYWEKGSLATDKYKEMANASVALSFVAFVAFACSSIVSAFIFCRFN